MGSHLNEKANYESPEGFPLIHGRGTEFRGAQGGYPPPQEGYPPTQEGYPPPQGGYDPSQGSYPPPQGGYPPPQGGYQQSQGINSPRPPITTQPTSQGGDPNSGWMSMPQGIRNCPPGLEYLTMIDHLCVNRQPNLNQTILGWDSKRKYVITNSLGENVYFAAQVSDTRSWRSFEMKIMDNFGNEVISMYRPLACQHCCCPRSLQSIEIMAPPDTMAGTVEQERSICYPWFVIKNSSGDVVLRIKGPLGGSAGCADINFMILSADGKTEVGKIYKKYSGWFQQFTCEIVFGIHFPMDLDVRMKAVMLGACFLIEMMYFKISGNMGTASHIPASVYRN